MSSAPAAAAGAPAKPRILCVDDEPYVLEGLLDTVGRRYDVTTAPGGPEGLAALRDLGPFEVIVSDMRMPVMDGARLLEAARREAPDTTRVLLTGYADMDAAVAAVNHGGVFRFLVKPTPVDELTAALESAIEQHRLVTAERVLLEETLAGSIHALTHVLSLVSPAAFGRASRIKAKTLDLLRLMEVQPDWRIEIAAGLCQIGFVALPEAVAEKLYHGARLDLEEREMAARVPAVTDELLSGIPRLEEVRALLGAALGPARELGSAPLAGQALRLALHYDKLLARGMEPQHVLDALRGDGEHGEDVLEALAKLIGAGIHRFVVADVPVTQLEEGMVFAQDVRSGTGALLVAHGHEATASLILRLQNLGDSLQADHVQVLVQPHSAWARQAA